MSSQYEATNEEIREEMGLEGVDYRTAQVTIASKKGCVTHLDNIPAGTLLVHRETKGFQIMVTHTTEKNIIGIQPNGMKRQFPMITPDKWVIFGWEDKPKGFE